ncbi:MAG TPA: hypothetical protein VK934_12045 [Fimbriimonas sp.]|nr:hypothetical protein [Fimbriimonas sp.]
MQREYTIVRTSFWRGQYSARAADGRELYAVRTSGSKTKFFVPGDEQPRFETRPRSFFSSEVVLVESAVDYIFASIKPSGGELKWEVRDCASAILGILIHGTKTIKPLDLKGWSSWKVLKETGRKYKEMARHLEFQVDEKPIVTFDLAKDYKSVTVKVIGQVRGVDERIVLAMAFRCLTISTQQSSG